MIFKIECLEDAFLGEAYTEGMKEMNDFYEIGWHRNQPQVFIVPDRKTINMLRGRETKGWETGWSQGRYAFYLDRNNYEKESERKYNEKLYRCSIKHELSHCFYSVLKQGKNSWPIWLCEGTAIYTSGQLAFKERPKEFKNFLGFYDNDGNGDVYFESGFVVELLVNKFGKQKLLELIKASKNAQTAAEFASIFKNIYGFDLTYAECNQLLT